VVVSCSDQSRAIIQSEYRNRSGGDVLVVDGFAVKEPKTKQFIAALKAVTPETKVLIISPRFDEATHLAARNVQPTRLITSAEVNTEHLLAFKKIVVTEEALKQLSARVAKS
jgi:large subunit ribosomal protein L4